MGGEAVLGRMDGDGVCSLAEVFEEDSTSDEVELDTVVCKDEKSIIGVSKMIKRLYSQYPVTRLIKFRIVDKYNNII